jgi:diaminopimelate decarboxylase
VIHNVGAYNMTQWMQFITLRPNVVLIDLENRVHVIRKCETMDAMNQFEQIPEHLQDFDL